MILIGVDIGGTFTDFVSYDRTNGEIQTLKLLSTPADPSIAVIQGMKVITKKFPTNEYKFTCIHGSTVATNALLERKGANTALITTAGFKDILQIGRQNRSELYNLMVEVPTPLIPKNQLYEIKERIDSKGNVLIPLEIQTLDKILESLQLQNVESVAVSLIFSFLNPEHETSIGKLLEENGFHVSISSEILPEFREYERTSTTVVNAYVSPILYKYLDQLEGSLEDYYLRVMQSNGGMISIQEAQGNGVRCILSGPAGGVIGAKFVTEFSHEKSNTRDREIENKLITFDMGGTSTDVSLIDGDLTLTNESIVDGYPIRIPMLDIHTIGAGGGSIAFIDQGGALRVGPISAGADPGPACYGKGTLPTVTDAHVVLDRIRPDLFLGGKMPLDKKRSIKAISTLADELNTDLLQTARGIVEITNAHMARALRLISVERGYDPREFKLFSFGGAGGLHAVDLAKSMGIPQVIVSPFASTLSALGMLAADIIKDYVRTVMLPGDISHTYLEELFAALTDNAKDDLHEEGVDPHDMSIMKSLDIRYEGQSYELNIFFNDQYIELFRKTHQDKYGYANPNSPVEIVNIRVRAIGKTPKPNITSNKPAGTEPKGALIDYQDIPYHDGMIKSPIYEGESLKFGNQIYGPAIIIRSDTTILLNPGDFCKIDEYQNLIIDIDMK